ncbi:MAG: hypothetical protein AB1405_03900 [Bdellovibrionota bacterium]
MKPFLPTLALLACAGLARCAMPAAIVTETADLLWQEENCFECPSDFPLWDSEEAEEDFEAVQAAEDLSDASSGGVAAIAELLGDPRDRHFQQIEAYLVKFDSTQLAMGEMVITLEVEPDGKVAGATLEKSTLPYTLKDFEEDVLMSVVLRDFPSSAHKDAERVRVYVRFAAGGVRVFAAPETPAAAPQGVATLSRSFE